MTRELIIEGQQVDLAPDTDITLEYVSNTIGDIGKISLSRSYTVKIPKTLRNARILDDPGTPGHESGKVRRFLSARFYRNGIDLIGPAQAYILKTTPDSYELALVWNTLEALQALSQSGDSINDLPDLPVLPWVGTSGEPDYNAGGEAFFAFYNSGLGASVYPSVNAATHPCILLSSLLGRILDNAGVPCAMSQEASSALSGKVLLAAPNHKPSRSMETESGSRASTSRAVNGTLNGYDRTFLYFGGWTHGWDAPLTGTAEIRNPQIFTGETKRYRVMLNVHTSTSVDLSGKGIRILGGVVAAGIVTRDGDELFKARFVKDDTGWHVSVDEEIDMGSWEAFSIQIDTIASTLPAFTAYDSSKPLLSVNRVHDTISIANDNRFPLAGNLPDIKQWDFVKAVMALSGLVPAIQGGVLSLLTYEEALDTSRAYDWTSKVDMETGEPQDMGYTFDGWARKNTLAFQENESLNYDPGADLVVQDSTLSEQRDFFSLPFAASMQSEALHYKVLEGGETEDIDIEPRVFHVNSGTRGLTLYFTDDMHGEGLIAARYQRLQEVVSKPVAMTLSIRLHEIDLAQLDITRPVYLGQFGKYYAISKIQTSDSDLCKVELIQLP